MAFEYRRACDVARQHTRQRVRRASILIIKINTMGQANSMEGMITINCTESVWPYID